MLETRKRKKYWIIAGVAAWFICLSGIFGNSGFVQAYKVMQAKSDMKLRIQALQNEKDRLERSLYALNHDSFIQEQTIREVLGFVREDELVFEFEE